MKSPRRTKTKFGLYQPSVIRRIRGYVKPSAKLCCLVAAATSLIVGRRADAQRGMSLGNPEAPITIVEFVDYQCPYCRIEYETLMPLIRERSDVRLVVHHFPRPQHPWAQAAAEVVTCASWQGNAYFLNAQQFLFSHQADITNENIAEFATRSVSSIKGFQIDVFSACLKERKAALVVQNDIDLARDLGVKRVPTLFINGTRLQGLQDESTIIEYLTQAAKKNPE